MSNDDLQLTPHQLQADGKRAGWWYEEPRGLSVVVQPIVRGKDGQSVWGTPNTVFITWTAVRNALKRKDKAKHRRVKDSVR